MLNMVQGKVSVLTLKHAIFATKTGALTWLLVVLMSFVPLDFKYTLPIFMFIGCFIVDLIIHKTHCGYSGTKAAVTALIASSLSFVLMFTEAAKEVEKFFK